MPRAGLIFAGTVLRVARAPLIRPDQVRSMQITFRVTRGIRGARTGQTITIREWAGLWMDGPRYLPGQQVVVLLYAPSTLGLTSPVGGPQGTFVVDARSHVRPSPAQRTWMRQQGLASSAKSLVPLDDFVRDLSARSGRLR